MAALFFTSKNKELEMAVNLTKKITLLKDAEEGKGFVFADGDETGTGKPFIVNLMPHDQMFFNKSYSKCTSVKFKRGRRDEVLDEDKFEKIMVNFYVRGWSNFTVKILRKYLAFNPADGLKETDQVDFTPENLSFLWSHSLEFRRQVNDLVMDPEQFNEDEQIRAGLNENFTNTSKRSAATASPQKNSAK